MLLKGLTKKNPEFRCSGTPVNVWINSSLQSGETAFLNPEASGKEINIH